MQFALTYCEPRSRSAVSMKVIITKVKKVKKKEKKGRDEGRWLEMEYMSTLYRGLIEVAVGGTCV